MALSRSEWIAHFSVFIIVLSMALIGVELTGRVTEGTVNITIVTTTSVNFTVDNVDWGEGAVDTAQIISMLDTSGNVLQGNWSAVNDGFTIENIGNVNVSLNLSSSAAAAAFIGGTSPTFEILVSDNETTSCIGNNLSSYTTVTGGQQVACDRFGYLDANDSIQVDLNITVPYDASGVKGATITATATTTTI